MKILAIETTGPKASVALINEKKQIWEETSDKELSHLQSLIPMIDNLLEKCESTIDDIDYIAVSRGPGSFTGIRIGVATGKALAHALNIPMISVPTLRAFAWKAENFNGLICPLFDARREQVYAGAYYWNDGLCIQAVTDDARGLTDFLSEIEDFDKDHKMNVMFFGDGTRIFEKQIEQWGRETNRLSPNDDVSRIMADSQHLLQSAASVAMEALRIEGTGGAVGFESMHPVYLRKAEAERKLEQRLCAGSIEHL